MARLNDFTSGDTGDDASSGTGGSGGIPVVPGQIGGSGAPSGSPTGSDSIKDLLIDYNAKFSGSTATLFRDALIEQTLAVLISKSKPNALLRGSAGVGKTRIVEDLARRIADDDPLVPAGLKGHTIYELPVAAIIAGMGVVGQLEERVNQIVDFAVDPTNKAIVFIDEIHQLTGSSQTGGSSVQRTISQILKPALARGDMRVIGATTSTEARAFDDDPAFSRRFTHLIVDELTVSQTREVLSLTRPSLLAHYKHQIAVSDDVLDDVVAVAEGNSRADQHRPDSAITLLDKAMADRVIEQNKLIAKATADGDTTLVQMLQGMGPVSLTRNRVLDVARRLMTGNATRPQFQPADLHQTLLAELQGQDDVVATLIDRVTRQELALFPAKVPSTWMFAGASGVGKTQAAKIIAQQITGADPIILNMAEYGSASDTAKIIGAPPGYVGSDSNKEMPFDSLESNPHRVILLDEFEKADRAVQRIFLSAFDEGYIRNASGKVLDFSKAVVICTTNAARESLGGPSIGFNAGPKTLSTQSLNRALAQHFDAELLGRFSLIVGFNPIDASIFGQVVAADYVRQREQVVAGTPHLASVLPASLPAETVRAITTEVFVEASGARPARRAVRRWLEDAVLEDRINAGSLPQGEASRSADRGSDEESEPQKVSRLAEPDED